MTQPNEIQRSPVRVAKLGVNSLDGSVVYKTVSDIFDGNQIVIQPVNVDGTTGGDPVQVFVLPTS